MKKLLLLILIFGTAIPAFGEVSATVFLADGFTPLKLADPNVPLIYEDVMEGTWLTIIIDSNSDGYLPCDLAISGENRNYGLLLARDFNESTNHYDGSIFENAVGEDGCVYFWHDELFEIDGFSYPGDTYAVAGPWFIFDYKATNIGECKVEMYEDFSFEPTFELEFSHVRTRDFNNDSVVNLADFAVFSSYWLATSCNEPDWCEGTDLNSSHNVDFIDFVLFGEYWLGTTGYKLRSCDFNKDNTVNLIDFARLASSWRLTDCGYPDWCQGTDLDADGDVDFNEFVVFANSWLE